MEILAVSTCATLQVRHAPRCSRRRDDAYNHTSVLLLAGYVDKDATGLQRIKVSARATYRRYAQLTRALTGGL